MKKVSLQSEIVESATFKNYIREKIIYNVEKDLSSVAWVCRPKRRRRVKFPAVLCCHGHGPGKDPLVGLCNNAPCLEYHKLVAVRLAQRGYLTITPDRRGYGDCSQFIKGFPTAQNLLELDAFYQNTKGLSLLAMDIRDSFRAIDAIASRKDVDTNTIGCLGMETGASVAAGVTAMDERINAVSLISFISPWPNLPGVSQLPLMAGKAGSVEFCGLICPRPLQVQMPEADPSIPLPLARKATKKVEQFYRLENSTGRFYPHSFDGVLELDFPSVVDFFDHWFDIK